MKRIYHILENRKGNIFILVLIIAAVALISVTAMIRYLMRDIEFIEVDSGELRALNIAEAGLSEWYLRFDKWSTEGSDPEDPFLYYEEFTETLSDSGNDIGRYTVNYSPDIDNEWQYTPFGYSIESTGEDIKSGFIRTIRVRLISLNIYDFIFSEEAMGSGQIAGNTNITGPFFVVGDFGMIVGNSFFAEGPLFVLGDIIIAGSSQIGTPDEPILLFMGGKMYEYNGPEVDPLDPPGNVYVYVAEFHNIMIDISLPDIDDAYIAEVKSLGPYKEIFGDLFIGNQVLKINGSDAEEELVGYLEFDEDGILNIDGNIIVNGNVDIGQSSGRKYTIEYFGHANIIATGNINAYSRTIPSVWYEFPEYSLLSLISLQNINLDMTRAQGGSSENDPNIAAMIIANGTVELGDSTVLTGSSISNTLILGQNAKIYYRYGIGEFLGPAVPSFNDLLLVYSWQELVNSN